MHNFTLASPPIPNIKFLSFVVSEKCVILKICTFSIKTHDFTRKKQQINLNFELTLNNSVIMLPTKNYVDRPKTKSAIALTKIPIRPPVFRQNISRLQLRCNSAKNHIWQVRQRYSIQPYTLLRIFIIRKLTYYIINALRFILPGNEYDINWNTCTYHNTSIN